MAGGRNCKPKSYMKILKNLLSLLSILRVIPVVFITHCSSFHMVIFNTVYISHVTLFSETSKKVMKAHTLPYSLIFPLPCSLLGPDPVHYIKSYHFVMEYNLNECSFLFLHVCNLNFAIHY